MLFSTEPVGPPHSETVSFRLPEVAQRDGALSVYYIISKIVIFFPCTLSFSADLLLYIQNQYTRLIHLIIEYSCLTGMIYHLGGGFQLRRERERCVCLHFSLDSLVSHPEVNVQCPFLIHQADGWNSQHFCTVVWSLLLSWLLCCPVELISFRMLFSSTQFAGSFPLQRSFLSAGFSL